MIVNGEINEVAFKEAKHNEGNKSLEYEKNMFDLIGDHGKKINFFWNRIIRMP